MTAVSKPCALGRFCSTAAPGAVAEEHAGVAVLPIHDGGELLRADDQHGVVGAGHDELLRDFQAVDETRAGGFQVKGRGAVGADLALHQAGGRGKGHVRRDRGHDDQVDLLGGDAGALHGAQGGLRGQVGGEFVLGGQPALFDAGAGGDPLVGGVHHLFQVGVGEDLGGHIGADAADGAGAALEVILGSGVLEFGSGSWTHVDGQSG